MTLHKCFDVVAGISPGPQKYDSPCPSGPKRFISKRRDTAEDSIVIPRSCSSSLESRNLAFPAIREEMILLEERRESAKEVLPWST